MAQAQAASAIVARGSAQERQIRGSLRSVVSRGKSYGARTVILGALSLVPMGLFTAVMLLGAAVSDDDAGTLFLLPTVVIAFLVSLALVLVATRLVATRQRVLERAFSAVPPAIPGQAAACHVCGGELTARGEGVVRCTYCAADNIVRPDVLARLASGRAHTFASLDEAATKKLAELKETSFSAGVISVVGALIAPIGVGMIAILIGVIYSFQSHPADATISYVIVQEGGRSCVGRLKSDKGQRLIVFGATRRPELPSSRPMRPGEDAEILHAADFIGRHLEGKDRDGVVQSVQSDLITGNEAMTGEVHGVALQGSCIKDPVPSPDP
jgi:hypothetical protein